MARALSALFVFSRRGAEHAKSAEDFKIGKATEREGLQKQGYTNTA